MKGNHLRLVDPTHPEFYLPANNHAANDDHSELAPGAAIGIVIGAFLWRAVIIICCAFVFLAVIL